MTLIKYIDAVTFKKLCDQPEILVIDIREADEYRYEHIFNAINCPLSNFNLNHVNELTKGKTVILHCQSGNRTKNNAHLLSQIDAHELFILEEGIACLTSQPHLLVKNNKATLPVMRQVQLIVGSSILFSLILSGLISKWFLLITAIFGLGLIFSGLTGYCGMAIFLNKLQNKNSPQSCDNGCQ